MLIKFAEDVMNERYEDSFRMLIKKFRDRKISAHDLLDMAWLSASEGNKSTIAWFKTDEFYSCLKIAKYDKEIFNSWL